MAAAPPRIALLGVGGVGGWLGARLLEAGKQVAEVVLIARGAHGAAIKDRGLRLQVQAAAGQAEAAVATPPGAAEVYSSVAEAVSSGARPVDYVILGVKTWQVPEAAAAAAPLLAADGCLVTAQNGVDAPQQAAEAVGKSRVLVGVAQVIAFMAEPGLISMKAQPARFDVGEAYGEAGEEIGSEAASSSPRVQRLVAALSQCQGVSTGVHRLGSWPMLWEKAILMCSMGPVAALMRAPLSTICELPQTRAMLRSAMVEAAQCGAAAGHLGDRTPEEAADTVLGRLDNSMAKQPGATPSTLRDVVTGRPSELNELTGGIVRAARRLGVAAPTHELVLAALLPQELRARGEHPYDLLGVPGGAPHVQA